MRALRKKVSTAAGGVRIVAEFQSYMLYLYMKDDRVPT